VGLVAVLALGVVPARAEQASVVQDMGALEAKTILTVCISAAVAFVTAVSILGAALAVGKIGSAAIGAAAEKPELLVRSLLFVALAEGLAILGFVVAMMLVGKMP
jgi:V/A-type H+-transporting ATPase subunit K